MKHIALTQHFQNFLLFSSVLLIAGILFVYFSDLALAQSGEVEAGTGAVASGQTLGATITNTVNSFKTVPGLLTGASYLFGIVLGFMAIWKLKEHVLDPRGTQIWDPMKRAIAAGAFFALPFMASVVIETVSKDGQALTGSNFNTGGAAGSDGLDGKLVDLMQDIWQPMQWIMTGFGYIAGVILIMIGISRLLKTEQEGPRGPTGFGTVMTFLVAGVLLSFNSVLGAAVGSIFGGGATNNATLAYTTGLPDGGAHANAVIGAVLAFVAIVGWISFIRGFFIMRGVAEGNSQASAMAGITHILGGSVAVNLGGFIKAVQSTLGIQQFGLNISNAEPYLTSVSFMIG